MNSIKGVLQKNCGRLMPDRISRVVQAECGLWKDENWYREIPFLSFMAPPLKVNHIREHVKNTYFPKKLLSRVTDNCMNTSPRLVRKYARILSADIICSKMRSFPRAKLEENCELRETKNVRE